MKKLILLLTGSFAFATADAQLAGGTYTINSALPASATNFPSFTAAATALNAGITGPVVLNVASGSGPYMEQVILPNVSGASSVNTITVNGNGALLTYNPPSSAPQVVLRLDGTKWATINNLAVSNTHPFRGIGIQLLNNADHNTINSCSVNLSGNDVYTGGICLNSDATAPATGGSLCDSNTISNNTIQSGCYAITCIGDAASRAAGNRIINNTVLNPRGWGIVAKYTDHMLIEGNDISRPAISYLNMFYGISLQQGDINAYVSKNRLHNFFNTLSGTEQGYYSIGLFTQSNASPGNENRFANNIIYDMNGSGDIYAMQNYGSYTHYYNNTVCIDNMSAIAGETYGYVQLATSGNVLRNNNIYISRGGNAVRYGVFLNTTATLTANNNNYFIQPGGGTGYIGHISSGDFSTLSAWQAASGQDAASASLSPLFTAAATGNLLPQNAALDNLGAPVAGIVSDIVNMPRSAATPDIGAFEFTASGTVAGGSSTVCSGATSLYTGSPAGGVWASSNTGVATISNSGLLNAIATGTTTLSYTTASGSASYVVSVVAPVALAPIGSSTTAWCVNTSGTFINSTAGGTWLSSATNIITINAATGAAMAMSPGTATISYRKGNGSCVTIVSLPVTVNANTAAVVSGLSALCPQQSTSYTSNMPGGSWATGNAAVAVINAATGLLTAVAPGTTTVIYTPASPCTTPTIKSITVNAAPPPLTPIIGDTALCAGTWTRLSNSTSTGVFTIDAPNIATINSTGLLSAITRGTATVTYTVTNASGCTASTSVRITVLDAMVVPVAIQGPAIVCAGDTGSFTDATPGGVWSSSDTGLATIDTAGRLTAKSAGTVTLSYTTGNGICASTIIKNISIAARPLPVITAAGAMLTSTPASTYQWKLNGVNITRATGQTYRATVNGSYAVVVTNANGCSGESTAYRLSNVHIAAIQGEPVAAVFPNPASQWLYIRSDIAATAVLVDIDGRVLLTEEIRNTAHAIDVRHLARGIYFLHIRNVAGRLVLNAKIQLQ